MIKQLLILITFLLIFLAACTAEVNDPLQKPEAATTSTPPALNTLPPETPKELPETPFDPTLQPQATIQEGENISGSSNNSGAVSPAEVDLSQITPEQPENIVPQEAPKPGVPDLGVAMAHQVSQDLARRLNLDISEVITAGIENKEWPDSSMDCPAPGMNYLSVITPGFKITLEASGTLYTYHTDSRENYVLCADDGQPVIP